MVIILMGVSGCGKTTVGRELQSLLDWDFYDADDYHPRENVEKMSSGIPLTDEDRKPWLEGLAREIIKWNTGGGNAILACSALKGVYRDMLGVDDKSVVTVFLTGDFDLLAKRLRNRKGHYMPPDLLRSQLDTLEEPDNGLVFSIELSPSVIAEDIVVQLGVNKNDSI
jgi:carbohydrate kinase (thermoresistant glucokinase family)